MNDLLKQIRDMLRVEDTRIFSSPRCSHILIEESDNNQKENTLKKVTISVGEEFRNWFAFSPDDFLNGKNKGRKRHSLFPLLNDTEDYQKSCDCVVVMLDENNNSITFADSTLRRSASEGFVLPPSPCTNSFT